jgi:hypothetical protein
MSESHPTAPTKTVKPAKPYRDFPLFPPSAGSPVYPTRARLADVALTDACQTGHVDRFSARSADTCAGRRPPRASEPGNLNDRCGCTIARASSCSDLETEPRQPESHSAKVITGMDSAAEEKDLLPQGVLFGRVPR